MKLIKVQFLLLTLFFEFQPAHTQMITQTYMGSDTLICQGNVRNGKRDSVWTYWDSEQRIARKMNYDKGKLSDTSYFFHHNGKIFGKENFSTGVYHYFFDNEKTMIQGSYDNTNGFRVTRYADSSLQSVGKMEAGKRIGEWFTVTKWKELLIEHYENGKKNGVVSKIDTDGNVLWEASFKEGKHQAPFVAYFPSTKQKVAERITETTDFAHFILYNVASKKVAELIFQEENAPMLVRTYYPNQLPRAEYYLLDTKYSEKIYEQDFSGTYLSEIDNWEEAELATTWERPRRKYLNYWREDGTKILVNKKGEIPEFMNLELFEPIDFLMPSELPSFTHLQMNETLSSMLHESYMMLSLASPEEKKLFYNKWKPKYDAMSLRTVYQVKNGYENGWATTYRKNGQEKSRQYYKKGKPNGKFYCFFKNKRLAAKGTYELLETPYFSTKMRVGKWTFYHANGAVAAKGKYKRVKSWETLEQSQGKKAGTWYYYDAEGNLLYKEENPK
ncbi:MAG: hypothetical protein ACKVTZ_06580 [Bacteroidia bacterium]